MRKVRLAAGLSLTCEQAISIKRWLREEWMFWHGRGVGTLVNVKTGKVSITTDKHGKANGVPPFLGLKLKPEYTPTTFTRGHQ